MTMWAENAAFVVWDGTNETFYFSYGTVPTAGGSWTNEDEETITATEVWSGLDVTYSPKDDTPKWWEHNAKKVVIESSFSSVKPESCRSWFCSSKLTTIEGLEYLNTELVTTMGDMFKDNLVTSLDLSHFDTSKVTDMSDMFHNCTNLTSLDLSNFNTKLVVSMQNMFSQCYALTALDLSNFDTYWVEDMRYMFAKCSLLKSIMVGDNWNTTYQSPQSEGMFLECDALVGEDGTMVGSTIDRTYANKDNGGYLTAKAVAVIPNAVGTDYWATYYKSNVNRVADANTTVYTAKADGDKVILTEVADRNIKAGQGVILKSTDDLIALTSTIASASDSYFYSNQLKGVDEDTETPEDTYVLGAKSSVVGFYKYTGANVGANKAYLTVAPGAREFLGFDNVTGIKSIQVINADGAVEYYDLSGRRFSQPRKGINIVKGKKVIVK